jgi:transposase
MQNPVPFAALVGIDWADKKHDVCLCAAGSTKRERSVVPHTPTALRDWANKLRSRFGGAPIAVCIELSQGPVVSALLEHDFFVLFPVQPKTLARYRAAFTTSGAKDDPTDAEFALELLLRHPDKLTRLEPESVPMRSLRHLVEARRTLVQDRVRITNRITAALKAYFPQVLDWFRDKEAAVFADFVERWPTLELVQRARTETLATFFRSHNVRYQTAIDRRIAAIRQELPLTTDPAAIQPNLLLVNVLLPQLRAACAAIDRLDDEIGKLAPELPDYALFRALPGAGAALAPRLLVAFGERRERFPDAASLQQYAGVAPITKRSGNKSSVHWRYQCPTFLRQTFIEWVGQTIPRSFWANAFYTGCKARGMQHQAALRALAFKWIRILYRCWVDRVPYDEPRYLMALRKRQAPLLKVAASIPN